jgi:hypothetical protein
LSRQFLDFGDVSLCNAEKQSSEANEMTFVVFLCGEGEQVAGERKEVSKATITNHQAAAAVHISNAASEYCT